MVKKVVQQNQEPDHSRRRGRVEFGLYLCAFTAILLFGNQPNVVRLMRTASGERIAVIVFVILLVKFFPAILGVGIELLVKFRLCQPFAFCGNVARSLLSRNHQEQQQNEYKEPNFVAAHGCQFYDCQFVGVNE
jgi:hypothetical protein